ncbi:MAG: hypothetical protein QOH90_111 [Actinomycetota bacterium]|nr:hypothetical protein [Actinomycetota bacterium]
MKRILVVALALLVLAACTKAAPKVDDREVGFTDQCGVQPACPVIASSTTEISTTMSRFEVGLINDDDAPIASPKIKMHARFFDLKRSSTEPQFEKDMDFIWTVKARGVGLYITDPGFDEPGDWGVEFQIEGPGIDESIKQQVTVGTKSGTPEIGDKVPASDTPTIADVKSLKEISTDPHPDPGFYKMSVADAVHQHRPFVVAFATPKFCQTQFCGPTLNKVKAVAHDFPNVTFIHSEIYKGLDPQGPVVSAVKQWDLPSEPWVFIVDKNGKLVQKYEVAFTPAELKKELSKL